VTGRGERAGAPRSVAATLPLAQPGSSRSWWGCFLPGTVPAASTRSTSRSRILTVWSHCCEISWPTQSYLPEGGNWEGKEPSPFAAAGNQRISSIGRSAGIKEIWARQPDTGVCARWRRKRAVPSVLVTCLHSVFVLYLAAAWFFRLLVSLSECCQLACAALRRAMSAGNGAVAGTTFQPRSSEVGGWWSSETCLSFSPRHWPLLRSLAGSPEILLRLPAWESNRSY